jgi:DNA-binding transcriptional LysR family regulator
MIQMNILNEFHAVCAWQGECVELYQLEAFEAIAAHGSFTRAAEALHLSQPAITRQIASLEAELRTRLFDRLGRTVRMTAAGEALHRYSEQIVRLSREAQHAVAEVGAGAAGRLAVGASSTLATYVLPSLLRRFRESHPRVEISVHTGASAQVLEMVLSNEADLGIVTSEVHDRVLVATVLAEYETCVVVPPAHPLARRGAVEAADLAGATLIQMESGTNLRTYVDRLLSAAGVEEQVALELDNVEAIKRMIEAELGISMLPEVAVRAEVAAGRLAALPLAGMPQANRQIRLVHRRDKYLSASARAFITLLVSSFQKSP